MLLEPDAYMNQAEMTAHDWLARAVRSIDGLLGEGYAKANPALLGAYLTTCAVEHLTSRGVDHVCASIGLLADALNE